MEDQLGAPASSHPGGGRGRGVNSRLSIWLRELGQRPRGAHLSPLGPASDLEQAGLGGWGQLSGLGPQTKMEWGLLEEGGKLGWLFLKGF